jgi:hypothetical protein
VNPDWRQQNNAYTTSKPGNKEDDFMWEDVRKATQQTKQYSSNDYSDTRKKPYDDAFGDFG